MAYRAKTLQGTMCVASGAVVLSLMAAGCGTSNASGGSATAPSAPASAKAVSSTDWWTPVCPVVVASDAALKSMQQNGPGDANWTDREVGQAAAAFGTEADAYQKVAEMVSSRPPIDLPSFQRYIALAAQRNKAIAAQMRQLQQATRTASTPDAALQIWLGKDASGSKLAQIIQSYGTQAKAIAQGDPASASRQSAEFSAPLSNMPGCSDAWRDFGPA